LYRPLVDRLVNLDFLNPQLLSEHYNILVVVDVIILFLVWSDVYETRSGPYIVKHIPASGLNVLRLKPLAHVFHRSIVSLSPPIRENGNSRGLYLLSLPSLSYLQSHFPCQWFEKRE